MKKTILIVLGGLFFGSSCSKSGDGGSGGSGGGGGGTNCSGVATSYANNVSPIIQSSCATDATCHGAGSASGPGPLLTHTQVFNARASIKVAVANGTMPKTGTLSTAQKNTIICWIDSGAPNN